MKFLPLPRWIGLVVACAPICAQPVLERMQPRGAQAGSAVRVKLEGSRLGPTPKILSRASFAATPLASPLPEGQDPAGELVYLLEVEKDAVPGVYPLRVETSEGLSNALLFTVGQFPQVMELEAYPDSESEDSTNDFPETAQAIEVPVTVEGRLQGAERDLFRIRARKGQQLVAEVVARRAGSAIDPSLELLDSGGRVLARNGDSRGMGLDARLTFTAEEDGEYLLVVRDERFSVQDQDFYRLTVGEYKFANGVFPLGWTRGSEVQAEFFGGNLSEPLRADIDVRNAPRYASEAWVRVPGTPSSVPFLLSDGREMLESENPGVLENGVVMNGRIAKAGEIDRYRLAVAGGDQWAFELRSGELPGSSLYGVMTIEGGNETLAVAGKHAGDPNPYIITTTGVTATYPFVNLTVPPDVSEITVSVEDLLDRGGIEFAYRLVARKQGPDFLLTINEPYINIPREGSAIVSVTAERRGYYGPIQLYLANAPDDIEVSGGQIAPTSTLGNTLPRFEIGSLTLTPKSGAELRRLDLIVRGKATQEGQEELDRRAAGPGIRVNVKGTEQPAVTAEWLGYDLPARVNPEQPAYLEFLSPRRQRLVRGAQGLIAKWSYSARQPGVQIKKSVDLPRNIGSLRLRQIGDAEAKESGEFRMFTHERTSLGMVNFNLSATVSADGRETTIYSKALEIDVVDGYGLESPEAPLVIEAGSEASWTGSIWREPEFVRTVTVSAVGLPVGLECQDAELASEKTGFELRCAARPDAPLGEHEVEIRAESMLSDEGTTRYIVDPVKTTLTVRR